MKSSPVVGCCFIGQILLAVSLLGQTKTRPKDTVIFETSKHIPAVPLKLRPTGRRSSGSSKPYALTRQSREGSTPGQPGFFLPTQELQTLASALPARTVRRLSEGHPRSTLRHRFYAAATGRYSIAVPSYHIAVGLVKWKIKIICRGCISIRKLRGRGSVR